MQFFVVKKTGNIDKKATEKLEITNSFSRSKQFVKIPDFFNEFFLKTTVLIQILRTK